MTSCRAKSSRAKSRNASRRASRREAVDSVPTSVAADGEITATGATRPHRQQTTTCWRRTGGYVGTPAIRKTTLATTAVKVEVARPAAVPREAREEAEAARGIPAGAAGTLVPRAARHSQSDVSRVSHCNSSLRFAARPVHSFIQLY